MIKQDKIDQEYNQKHQILDECQIELCRSQEELKSYVLLFSGLKGSSIPGEALYGVGRALRRMKNKLDKINEKLSNIY